MAARSTKKGVSRQPIVEEMRAQVVDRQLFTLQYLHHTLNYVLFDNKSLQHYLEVDQSVLNVSDEQFQNIVHKHPSDLGLHFVQRIKLMKERCDEDLFVKDLQEYGDFINYDLPNTYQRDLKTIESELQQQISMQIHAKRLKKYYPFLANRMTINEVESMNRRLKQDILSQLMNNVEMIPQEQEEHLEKNTLYREMFGITGYVKEESMEMARGIQRFNNQENRKQHSMSESGIANKIRNHDKKNDKEKKGAEKSHKSKKILRVPKKEEGIANEYEEYLPKSVFKKMIKSDQNLLIIERPILQNPFSQQQKQQMGMKVYSSIMLNESGQIKQQTTVPVISQKSEQKMVIQKQTPHKMEAKDNMMKIKKEHSESKNEENHLVSNSQQNPNVKRKYNRAPKEKHTEGQVKVEKVTKAKGEKADKQKNGQGHQKQSKISGEQVKKKKTKKVQHSLPVCIIKEPITDNNGDNKIQTNIPNISYVSIAIQTNNNPESTINQQKSDIPQMQFDAGIKIQDKANLLQQLRFQEPKQEDQQRNSSIVRSEMLRSSLSYENQSLNESRRMPGIRADQPLEQSSMSISNPFYSDHVPEPINEEAKSEHIAEDEHQLDISQFLN